MIVDDLVAGVFAFKYHKGISHGDLVRSVLSGDGDFLKSIGVVPHHMHGDSIRLEECLTGMVQRGVLKHWLPDNTYTWDFPSSPIEYLHGYVNMDELRRIKKFVDSLA